ncbi:MAG: thiamine phosphate synthase [Planctomycetota bacterium]
MNSSNTVPMDAPQAHIRLRVLDANANRAAEGLRVVEEFARFALNDAFLAERLKQSRHRLATAVAVLPQLARLAARDTPGDVGTRISTQAENQRPTIDAIVAANLERVEQALRCIEEYAKGFAPTLAVESEALRYDVYTLAEPLQRGLSARSRLRAARLYVLIDGAEHVDQMAERAAAILQAGVDVVQLRDKRLSDRELLDRARVLRRLTAKSRTLFIVNDRPDIAAISEADGVHVGQDELTVKDARRVLSPAQWVGVSTHDLRQAQAAISDGADYIGCGPTFPSGTKSFDRFPGLEFLRQVAAEIGLPAFAIGGIDTANISDVMATGISRVAVSGAVWRATDPAAAAAELARRLREIHATDLPNS